jgi:hypothetical protein
MNTWLAIAAIAVTCVFFVWILTRQSSQQRAGTIHHPEDEQLREDADTRDVSTRLADIPWRDGGHAPPPDHIPPAAAPDAVNEPAVFLEPEQESAQDEASSKSADAESSTPAAKSGSGGT